MRALGVALVLGLVVVAPATAAPWIVSTFDEVGDATGTAADLVGGRGLCTIEGDADDDVAVPLCTNARCRKAANGGNDTSRRAGALHLEANERGGWTLCEPVSVDHLVVGWAMHVGSGEGVSANRTVARILNGATAGCSATLETDGDLALYWQGALVGTAFVRATTRSCTTDTTTGCVDNSTCVAPDECAASCSTSSGAGCFWPYPELEQIQFPSGTASRVQCRLLVGGAVQADSGLLPVVGIPPPITNAEVGGPVAEAGTLRLAVDDVAMGPERLGHVVLRWSTPTAMANPPAAQEASCGTGTVNLRCVDDYGVGPDYVIQSTPTNDHLTARTGGGAAVARFGPTMVASEIPAGASIVGVEVLTEGQTGDDPGTFQTDARVALCSTPGAVCEKTSSATTWTHAKLLAAGLTGIAYADTVPGSSQPWTVATVNKAGATWQAVQTAGSARSRLGALGLVTIMRRPDVPPLKNLQVHHLGPDGSDLVCAASGDSIACGTVAGLCRGGTNAGARCNQRAYCSWDGVNQSKPSGSCLTNAECRTCGGATNGPTDGRRGDFNNGAGWPCAGPSDCDLGTCSSGKCTGGTGDVACNVDADCQLGPTCDTTATCVESCPGGECPPPAGWPYFMDLPCDSVLNCCQDGITTKQLLSTHWPADLYGRGSLCKLVAGKPGRCECVSDADCESVDGGTCTTAGGLGRCWLDLKTTCATGADCASTVCLGQCTASDVGRDVCTQASECAAARPCVWAPPSYVLPGPGANDWGWTTYDKGDCRQPYAATGLLNPNTVCDNCAETACTSNAGCAGISPSSWCLGKNKTTAGLGCMGPDQGEAAVCSVSTKFCRVDGDCRAGQTCLGATGGTEYDGVCSCDAPGDCDAGYSCVGNFCRKTCTAGTATADCGTAGTCNTGLGVCEGACSCPCSSVSCATDLDCPSKTIPAFGNYYPARVTTPRCVAGKCADCGRASCRSATSQWAYTQNYQRWSLGTWQAEQYRALERLIASEAAALGDATVPLVVPVTFVEGRATAWPTCEGWPGVDLMADRAAVQLRDEWPVVVDTRPCTAPVDTSTCYVDAIHTAVVCADAMGTCINRVLSSLNACRTGTGADSAPAYYCRNPDGTWASATPCASAAECTPPAQCRARACTVNDDTAAGCPGAPSCWLESDL